MRERMESECHSEQSTHPDVVVARVETPSPLPPAPNPQHGLEVRTPPRKASIESYSKWQYWLHQHDYKAKLWAILGNPM